jgi:hypothetical protein
VALTRKELEYVLTRDPLIDQDHAPPAGCLGVLVAMVIGLVFFGVLALVVWRSVS